MSVVMTMSLDQEAFKNESRLKLEVTKYYRIGKFELEIARYGLGTKAHKLTVSLQADFSLLCIRAYIKSDVGPKQTFFI